MARLDWSRLHSRIVRSSLYLKEPPMTRLVFLTAVADSEKDGTLYGSIPALARAWNLEEKDVAEAFERLQRADPDSTTPDENGRRILPLGPNEWLVTTKAVNSPSGEPPGASTDRVRLYRERMKKQKETEEEAKETRNGLEREQQEERQKRLEEKRGRGEEKENMAESFGRFWISYPKKVKKPKAALAWKKLSPSDQEGAIDGLKSFAWPDPQFIPYPEAWLNGRRWEDEPLGPTPTAKPAEPTPETLRRWKEQEDAEREIAEVDANRKAHGLPV